jgi:hypothetical protein
MADMRNGFLIGFELFHQRKHLGVTPQLVRSKTPGNQQGIKVFGVLIADGGVTHAGIAMLSTVGLSRLRGGDHHFMAGLLQTDLRVPEFQVFVNMINNGENAFHGGLIPTEVLNFQ